MAKIAIVMAWSSVVCSDSGPTVVIGVDGWPTR